MPTIWAAFFVRAGYWLWSASVAVGMDPGEFFQKVTCVEPLDKNSMNAFTWPRLLLSVVDFLLTM